MIIKRIIARLNWLYKEVFKQEDPFWVYYYPVTLNSLFMAAYICGMMNYSGFYNVGEDLTPFYVVTFLILGLNCFFFGKNRKKIEKEIEKEQLKIKGLDFTDLFSLLYIVIGIVFLVSSLMAHSYRYI